jgi:hypothetical protein
VKDWLLCRLHGHPGWQSQETIAALEPGNLRNPIEYPRGSGVLRNWTKWRCVRCGEKRENL